MCLARTTTLVCVRCSTFEQCYVEEGMLYVGHFQVLDPEDEDSPQTSSEGSACLPSTEDFIGDHQVDTPHGDEACLSGITAFSSPHPEVNLGLRWGTGEQDVEESIPWDELPLSYRIDDVMAHSASLPWQRASLDDDVDVASFMMHRERSRSRDDSQLPPANLSSSDHDDDGQPNRSNATSDADSTPLVIWRLLFSDMPFAPVEIQASEAGPSIYQVAHAISFPVAEIAALHTVHSLQGDDSHIILIECNGDHIHPGSEAVTLFDVQCVHRHADGSLSEGPHQFLSFFVARAWMFRSALLGILRLTQLAANFPDAVLLAHKWPGMAGR